MASILLRTENGKRWMKKLVIFSLLAFVYYSGCGNSAQSDLPINDSKEGSNDMEEKTKLSGKRDSEDAKLTDFNR